MRLKNNLKKSFIALLIFIYANICGLPFMTTAYAKDSSYEEQNLHNTYDYEQALFRIIKEGNTEQLVAFLNATYTPLNEGKLASSPLRHAKNLFILTVTKAGILGAIPGGVNVELVYHLTDMYIQECEQAQSIEAVKTLQYSMLLDFCRRAGEAQIPEGLSKPSQRTG